MDVRQLTRLLRLAAKGSLVLLGATVVHAGDRPHEQPTRPHMSATCSPNWGFNQTCWSRFPEVPPCQGSGCNVGPEGYENNPSQQMLYSPQNPMTYQNSQIVSPVYGSSQRPISVLPDSVQAEVDASSGGMSTMPVERAPHSSAQQYFGPSLPSAVPSISGEHTQPLSPLPAAPTGLPPLPAPPMSAPGHSLWQPNMNFNPNQQQMMRPAAVSNQALQSGSRYGIANRSMKSPQIVPPTSALITSRSFTNTLVNNNHTPPQTTNSPVPGGRYGWYGSPAVAPTSRIPVSFASQSRVLPKSSGSSTSYRSGTSMPPVVNSSRAGFQATQLPMIPNYPTMPVEPLRSTP
jgi:hypothetical protein